jgi:hypothetical protein
LGEEPKTGAGEPSGEIFFTAKSRKHEPNAKLRMQNVKRLASDSDLFSFAL